MTDDRTGIGPSQDPDGRDRHQRRGFCRQSLDTQQEVGSVPADAPERGGQRLRWWPLGVGGGVTVEVSMSMIRRKPDAVPRSVGLAFYPGARVDPQARAHLLRPIAEVGFEVVIFKQPYNLAILDSNAADAVVGDPDDSVDEWVIGGHSLGGAMASRYAEPVRNELAGLLLYAAYPVIDMSARSDLTVMSVLGTEDGIAERVDIEGRMSDLPPVTELVVINGAIHSFFGDYGRQRGDATPGVSREEARTELSDATIRLLETIEGK